MVTAIHGESDDFGYAMGTPEFPLDGSDGSFRSVASYADALLEWQRDYEAGVKGITGQSEGVPLLVSTHAPCSTRRVSLIQATMGSA
jgi:hypothetical protein